MAEIIRYIKAPINDEYEIQASIYDDDFEIWLLRNGGACIPPGSFDKNKIDGLIALLKQVKEHYEDI